MLRRHRAARGLSIVELLIGVAIGLFVVAAATMLVVTQLADNRRLTLETQVQQDLRASADIIARELRRAGHWGRARDGVWYPGRDLTADPLRANPYVSLRAAADGAELADDEQTSTLHMSYARSAEEADEDGAIVDAERLGFRVDNGVIQTQLGNGNWQALTDANTLQITTFTMRMDKEPIVLACARECPGGGQACWPVQEVRRVTVRITGRAAHDAQVQRSVRGSVRLRNDVVTGACPA